MANVSGTPPPPAPNSTGSVGTPFSASSSPIMEGRPRIVVGGHSTSDQPTDLVAERVIVSQDPNPPRAVLAGKQIIKLKEASKGLWDWILSFFPATPSRTLTNLVKSFVEHREVGGGEFTANLLAGKYGLEVTPELIKNNFAAIKGLLGPEQEKKFLYLLIGEDCKGKPASHFDSVWKNFIVTLYGNDAATNIFRDVIMGGLIEHVKSNPQESVEDSLRFLASALTSERGHPLCQSSLVADNLIVDIQKAGARALRGSDDLSRAARLVAVLKDGGFSDGTSEAPLRREAAQLKTIGTALSKLATNFKNLTKNLLDGNPIPPAQSDLLRNIFGPSMSALPNLRDLQPTREGDWNVVSDVMHDETMRGDWNRRVMQLASRRMTDHFLKDAVSPLFSVDFNRATYRVGRDVLPRGASVNLYNEKFIDLIKLSFPSVPRSNLNFLRYQIQDFATQRLFVMDNKLFGRVVQEYSSRGYTVMSVGERSTQEIEDKLGQMNVDRDELKKVSYTVTVDQAGVLKILAEKKIVVLNADNVPIGFDMLRVEIAINLKKVDSGAALFNQPEGVVEGRFQRLGFRSNWSDVHF